MNILDILENEMLSTVVTFVEVIVLTYGGLVTKAVWLRHRTFQDSASKFHCKNKKWTVIK